MIANHIAQVLSSEMTIKAFTEGLNNISFREMKEFFELHQMLNSRDVFKRYDKACQTDADWLRYTRPLRVRRPRGLNTHQEMNYHLGVVYSWEEVWEQYKEAELERTREANNKLEEEIAIYEWLINLPGGNCTDNDIACQTAYEIAEATKREHQLSQIACDAVKKHVHYDTIVRFMNEMCKDDKERAFFLQEYSNAQWRDGRFN